MISTQRIIHCTNPDCANPINPVGDSICASCHTPLIHRYLWAKSAPVAIKAGEKIAQRYEVIAPQIWLDTQPGLLPHTPEELSKEILPYLRLHPQRLHLPQVYGFAQKASSLDDILLLENAPIDEKGNLYPTIDDVWEQATAVRQVYWLWQILQLWTPLLELGVASSLLVPYNLRVQGWCVRLLELVDTTLHVTSLQQLADSWQKLVTTAKPQVAPELAKIVQLMGSSEVELEVETLRVTSLQLNNLLLSSAAELPLNIKVAGATDIGPELPQNEDNCFPTASDSLDDPMLARVSIVCDGIGGHEGGEVASQLAVQSLKLQIRALIAEAIEQTELVTPELLQQQLEAILRIVNNVICNCNNEQKREGTQRMGTTVAIALQLPQQVQTTAGWQSENAHELYLASVGDSRAYWITRNYCQLLTIDDDVATREVRYGRSLYRKALQRLDATALTQALGTKDGEFLRPTIGRFIVEEDGLLLLCSDGLSDNNLVEQYWRDYAVPVLTGVLSLEDAVRHWINLANQKNAHDNTSVVLTHCRVSPEYLVQATRALQRVETLDEEPEPEPEQVELTQSSQALLDLDVAEPAATPPSETQKPPTQPRSPRRRQKRPLLLLGLLALLLGGTSLGLFAWSQLNPQGFKSMCQQLPQKVQQLCPR